jgi:creatinine amidohydrolase
VTYRSKEKAMRMIRIAFVIAAAAILPTIAGTQTTSAPRVPSAQNPDPNSPRPVEALDSVFIEELTWMEVRDAIRAGKTTAIIATGGVEQNGGYTATGKHNYVLQGTTEILARRLGNALVAPIVTMTPNGNFDPPTGMMRFPGTISLQEETFQALLSDIATSLKTNGFRHIILVGDSGGNPKGMQAVADKLSAKWAGGTTTIHHIPEFYDFDYPEERKWLAAQGVKEVPEGYHDNYMMTALLMTVDPTTVRYEQRVKAGKASINGVPITSADKTVAIGKRAVESRVVETVKAIKKAIGTS